MKPPELTHDEHRIFWRWFDTECDETEEPMVAFVRWLCITPSGKDVVARIIDYHFVFDEATSGEYP